ncbi:hypothetical protein Ddc_07993 [Ditylenchus destructor]|nr:hypothetical protein Ddc_07993 [Ditylenchus destructor]
MTLQASWNTPRRSVASSRSLSQRRSLRCSAVNVSGSSNVSMESIDRLCDDDQGSVSSLLRPAGRKHVHNALMRPAGRKHVHNLSDEKNNQLVNSVHEISCDEGFESMNKNRSQNPKRNSSSRYSSPDDDSQCGDDSSQQLSLGLLHAMKKRNFLLRSSSPDDDSQCGDDSSLQLNMGLMHTKNLFLSSCSMMHLRNTHLPAVSILSTETVMDFSSSNVDRHGSSKLRWIGSVASQFVLL